MHVHPDIAALRSDRASQRRLQERMTAASDAWHKLEPVAAVRRELAAYAGYAGNGTLGDHPALMALIEDHGAAQEFVAAYFQTFIPALRANPLGEAPFRHNSSPGFVRVRLLQSGGAMLSLCAYEQVQWNDATQTVQFADCESHEIVISGAARGRTYRRTGGTGAIATSEQRWRAGDRIVRLPLSQTRLVLQVEQSLLVLQLSRAPNRPRPSREYRLSDGALVRETSGDKRASEQVMALGVLGALGGDNVIAPIASFASDTDHDRDARWEAVRQLLALDSGRGFALLGTLAARTTDPLCEPAARLRDQLVTDHPQLRQLYPETA